MQNTWFRRTAFTLCAAIFPLVGQEAVHSPKIEAYIDFGVQFGAHIWPFITYPAPEYTGVLDTQKFNTFLDSLFREMQNVGQQNLYLSFAQLSNIDAYATGQYTTLAVDASYDVVMAILESFQKNSIQTPGAANFLQYLAMQAKNYRQMYGFPIRIVLAFGGASARDQDFQVLQKPGDTYAAKAASLAKFVRTTGLSGVDFDIESATALASQATDSEGKTILDFFAILCQQLTQKHKTCTLTTELGHVWRSVLQNLLGKNFASHFTGLNLMAYSNTQYWLDTNTPTGKPDEGWTIEEWIDAIGQENASLIHIGFEDGVHYADPSANGGQVVYNIPSGSSDGQAAAYIYRQIRKTLKQDGYPYKLGKPFFWPDLNVRPNGSDRYQPLPDNSSNFVSSTMKDFFDALSQEDENDLE